MKHSISTYQFFFSALANPNRLQIINVLRGGRKNVGEICSSTEFEQTMVSHNLKVLEYHGMVFMEKEGKFRYYEVNRKTIKPLLEFIDSHMEEYCCKLLKQKRRTQKEKHAKNEWGRAGKEKWEKKSKKTLPIKNETSKNSS